MLFVQIYIELLTLAVPPAMFCWLLYLLMFDGWSTRWSRHVSRTHFGRPSFAMWVDKDDKLHIQGGEDPDHSVRTQRAMGMERSVGQKLLFFTADLLSVVWQLCVYMLPLAFLLWLVS